MLHMDLNLPWPLFYRIVDPERCANCSDHRAEQAASVPAEGLFLLVELFPD